MPVPSERSEWSRPERCSGTFRTVRGLRDDPQVSPRIFPPFITEQYYVSSSKKNPTCSEVTKFTQVSRQTGWLASIHVQYREASCAAPEITFQPYEPDAPHVLEALQDMAEEPLRLM